MDLGKIKLIVNSGHPLWDKMLLEEIAKGDDAMSVIIELLDNERKRKKELIDKLNLLLSKADCGLDNPKINKDGFMQKEIEKFYLDNKLFVGHCFKNLTNEKK